MNDALLKLYVKFQNLVSSKEGQDLVEYALVVAIIALGCVATMRSVATTVSTSFSLIESSFAASV